MQGPIGKAKHLKDMAGGPVGRMKRKINQFKNKKMSYPFEGAPIHVSSNSVARFLYCIRTMVRLSYF